jgi:hypothetical protein
VTTKISRGIPHERPGPYWNRTCQADAANISTIFKTMPTKAAVSITVLTWTNSLDFGYRNKHRRSLIEVD